MAKAQQIRIQERDINEVPSISEKYDRKFFPDFFFAGLGSVFRFCISDILLRCYFLLFFILLFFILIMFRDF